MMNKMSEGPDVELLQHALEAIAQGISRSSSARWRRMRNGMEYGTGNEGPDVPRG